MNAPVLPRRGFLRGLASLPLIGGGVMLIGQPTAAAVPITPDLIMAYGRFCWAELLSASDLMEEAGLSRMAWVSPGVQPVGDARRNAAVVLSAAGLPLPAGRS